MLCTFITHLFIQIGTYNTAVGRVVTVIESMAGSKLSHNTILDGYCHVEALSEHTYEFCCIHCGYHPPILIVDVNRKAAISLASKSYNVHHLYFVSDSHC